MPVDQRKHCAKCSGLMHAKARAAPEDDEHVTNQVHQVTLVQLESTCFYTEHCKSWTLIRNGPLSEVVHQGRLLYYTVH